MSMLIVSADETPEMIACCLLLAKCPECTDTHVASSWILVQEFLATSLQEAYVRQRTGLIF